MSSAPCWPSVLLALFLWTTAPPATAQDRQQLVYWPLITDGHDYRRVAYPEEAGPLVVLADTEVVIEPRMASVSYWPITREYLADMARSTAVQDAKLEVIDGSGSGTLLEPEAYVVWHPEGVGAGPAELIRGAAAAKLYDEYVSKARASAQEVQRYQRMRAEHQALLEAWLRMAGERRGENMPDPPPELNIEAPEPYQAFATEPAQAFVASLPVGNYALRLRGSDGRIIPGSERTLVSFGPLDRGIGYVIRPEDRWTQPTVSFDPQEVIYMTGGTDLFLQPVPVAQYQARNFTRLFRPQSVEVADPSLTIWVPLGGGEEGATGNFLALWRHDKLVQEVPSRGFRVDQVSGALRGYTINEFEAWPDASLEPDFVAMRVADEAEVTELNLTSPDGKAIEHSDRQIRRIRPPAEPLLFLPALLPLALAAVLRAGSGRRRR